jgi:hypothetical protein
MERKQGKIITWHEQKGWGVIQGTSSILDRWFMHIRNIRGTVPPVVGLEVTFEPGPARQQGDLPPALKVLVIPAAQDAQLNSPEVSPESENVGSSL